MLKFFREIIDKRCGYKFYGQFEYPVDKFIYDRYFSMKKGGVFVECGAF